VTIVDAANGNCVGSLEGAHRRPSWFSWLLPSAWEVVETDDRSLVFTLRRSWRFSAEWCVRDSEGKRVGSVLEKAGRLTPFRMCLTDVPRRAVERLYETRIEDSWGRCVAHLRTEDGGTALFVTPNGAELGSLSRQVEETQLTFAEAVAADPFTRMLLLAAALVCG
jgi:hypothetical protein